MTDRALSDEAIGRILRTARTIAMVGASPNPARPSNGVLAFLLSRGYRVFPINPGHVDEPVHGTRFFRDLKSIPEPIDMVDIFRASEAVPGIVDEVLSLDPRPKVIWTQLGVTAGEAGERAKAAGIEVVVDRCPKIEYARLGLG